MLRAHPHGHTTSISFSAHVTQTIYFRPTKHYSEPGIMLGGSKPVTCLPRHSTPTRVIQPHQHQSSPLRTPAGHGPIACLNSPQNPSPWRPFRHKPGPRSPHTPRLLTSGQDGGLRQPVPRLSACDCSHAQSALFGITNIPYSLLSINVPHAHGPLPTCFLYVFVIAGPRRPISRLLRLLGLLPRCRTTFPSASTV